MKPAWLTTNRSDAIHAMTKPPIWPGLAALALAGCVTVKAPDRPIEINLNISVKQEVVVSLNKDAENFIATNPDLFPK